MKCSPGEVLGDFDLYVTEIKLTGDSISLFLSRIVRLFRPGRATLESTIPVVGDERFLLVRLG